MQSVLRFRYAVTLCASARLGEVIADVRLKNIIHFTAKTYIYVFTPDFFMIETLLHWR